MKKLLLFTFIIVGLQTHANDLRIVNLKGNWKFSLGFKSEWIKPEFNDAEWDQLYVPMCWEDQGFYGYDGIACYRKKFDLSESYRNKDLNLVLGYIDDCDEVFVNGNQIGISGSFPPNYTTAFNFERKYNIPAQLLNYGGLNVIVVKVYDDQQGGGIVNGDIAIYEGEKRPPFDIVLSGMWSFRTGDNKEFKNPHYNDSKWVKITVPIPWESQGYNDYDGFAWYRKSFIVPENLTKQRLVLMLGKIDDYDEVYLNGNYIGLEKNLINTDKETRFDQLRVYYFEGSLLNSDKPNVLSIRVCDIGGRGGIYEGPVGLMGQKTFIQFWRNKK